jgi:mannonate dehydratase
VRRIGEAGIPVLCYNFMPIFDWTRTSLALLLADGSTALAYDHDDLALVDLSRGTGDLPGWAAAYDVPTLGGLLTAYAAIDEDALWANLSRFLERVVPVAESVHVRMAMHPDDPPWPIFGLPRIITNAAALDRLTRLVDRPANGVTFCTGSLGADAGNDLPGMIRDLGARDRIHFMHCRNVRRTGPKHFYESEHPSRFGDVDMFEVMRALADIDFGGPMRPDHGRMIWGEQGRPGYGLHDRALGAMYLQGLWEGIERTQTSS